MEAEPNFKVTIQAANRASAHNHFHVFCDGRNSARVYHGSYMTLGRAQSVAEALINPAVYDRKGKAVAVVRTLQD